MASSLGLADDNRTCTVHYNDLCDAGILLPIFPFEASWNSGVRAVLYCFGLFYCFMGVAIVGDVFMGSIEKITSKTKKIYLSTGGKDTEPEVIEVKLWNDTVANLTLMALGSSAPEISLSCIEIVGNNFESGVLGPSTIVGSAAFNLLIICAVCIMTIPNGEVRRVKKFNVFLITGVFSLIAYIWVLVILQVISPEVVEIWEAVLTLLFLPIFILIAWWADCQWTNQKRAPKVTDQQIELGIGNGRAGGERETMLEKQKMLFTEDGNVKKEALIEVYKELRRFPHLSDSDAAIIAATKLIDSQPHSRLWYRIGAVRGLSGGRRVHPVLNDKLRNVYATINEHPDASEVTLTTDNLDQKAIVEFHAASYAVPENIGEFNITVVRHGRMDNTVRVRVESFGGTANAGLDYIPVNEQLVFGPYTEERELTVKIIDDNQWEPDEEFFLRLSVVDEGYDRREVTLGRLPIMEIIILNDDKPGVISFRKRGLLVKESCQFAAIEVERTNGAHGEVSIQWRTIDGSAKSPKDYHGGEGTLVFKDGEMLRTIEIPIVDDLKSERDECFEIELLKPEGGATLGRMVKMAVTISNDDEFNSVLERMMAMTSHNIKAMQVHRGTWRTQIESALTVNGGDVESATAIDYLMHFLTFGWKVLFALIPPPRYFGGWLSFVCSLSAIGVLTAIIGDLASIFGCLINLKDSVTAITFVSIGTSLPDLFASKTAALSEKYADNAVGNVTGSNSVNVFLGLGLPWLMAAIFHQANGTTFAVPAGDVRFSVAVYSAVAFAGLALISLRRFLNLFGKAELGGPVIPKYMSGIFLISLWFVYIILSSLQAYGKF